MGPNVFAGQADGTVLEDNGPRLHRTGGGELESNITYPQAVHRASLPDRGDANNSRAHAAKLDQHVVQLTKLSSRQRLQRPPDTQRRNRTRTTRTAPAHTCRTATYTRYMNSMHGDRPVDAIIAASRL